MSGASGHLLGLDPDLSVPNIRLGMDAENRRGILNVGQDCPRIRNSLGQAIPLPAVDHARHNTKEAA